VALAQLRWWTSCCAPSCGAKSQRTLNNDTRTVYCVGKADTEGSLYVCSDEVFLKQILSQISEHTLSVKDTRGDNMTGTNTPSDPAPEIKAVGEVATLIEVGESMGYYLLSCICGLTSIHR
jgi:hypothetical protein